MEIENPKEFASVLLNDAEQMPPRSYLTFIGLSKPKYMLLEKMNKEMKEH